MAKTTLEMMAGRHTVTTGREAWETGTNIRTAMRLDPAGVSVWLCAQVARTCQLVDASTTIRDDAELVMVVDALIEEFPAMKLEEWQIVLRDIARSKFGPLYNRLKLPEFMECARKWETKRAEMLERMHRPGYDPHRRASADVPKRVALMLTPADMAILDRVETGKKKGPAATTHPKN